MDKFMFLRNMLAIEINFEISFIAAAWHAKTSGEKTYGDNIGFEIELYIYWMSKQIFRLLEKKLVDAIISLLSILVKNSNQKNENSTYRISVDFS